MGTSKMVIQIPLGVTNEQEARRIAVRLSDEMNDIFERLLRSDTELPDDIVAAYFDYCLRKVTQDLTKQRRKKRMSGSFSDDDKKIEEMRLIVMRQMSEDGLSHTLPIHRVAEFSTPEELEMAMIIHGQQYKLVMSSLKRPHFKAAASIATRTKDRSSSHESQLLEAYLHATTAAMEAVTDRPAAMTAAARARASELVVQRSKVAVSGSHAPRVVTAEAPTDAPVSITPTAPLLTSGVEVISIPITHSLLDAQFQAAAASTDTHDLERSPKTSPFAHDLAGVCERSIRRAQADGRMDDKTALGRRMSVKLFIFITDQQLVTRVEQHHIRIFMNALKSLPANFLKSESDRSLTYPEVAARASTLSDDKLGRSAGTSNRHLDTIGAIVKYARVQDKIDVDRDIDTSSLRVPENTRSRNKRVAFKHQDVLKLFRHPIWTGCKGKERRHAKGNNVIQDGLYWVPLIIHYTGARFEEIAGMPVSAIIQEGEHWGLDISPHTERRLKNIQSERLLPIHEHLVSLGLIRHQLNMVKVREEFMFPELRPAHAKSKFAKKMKYNWDKARRIQLGASADDLTMHSLRHYVNITLKADKSIEKSVRMDILGHAAEDFNEEVYSSGTPFDDKLKAINAIPRAF
ncbi:hypothetical protein [Roseovarius dicentrarchi]|uniref:hypothetical protein n=1 Tax=Roseovarius dicentrarchi TaxID=2250573 RepID=UPI00193A3C5A|nr:hypothetical protein [Roseovarius dicentrarchi]